MKKIIYALIGALFLASCVKEYTLTQKKRDPQQEANVNRLQTTEEFQVDIKEGCVTQVIIDGDIIAEAISPMTILIPKQTSTTKALAPLQLAYIPRADYPNLIENRAKLYQVICFEDSRNADYDYNDLVIHVLYKTQGDIFGFGVQPVALGSTKSIKLGCVVYKGDVQIYKGLLTPPGKDCRTQYFESQENFINTVGTEINQQNGGWKYYLASTIRNWTISKYPGDGAMRVEWYIEVENGDELYALSTSHLDQSFDKNALPYGLIITETGSQYIENGMVCGKDWFNYPQESSSMEEVYPEIWRWLNTTDSYDFSAIYHRDNIPDKAFPASDLGAFVTTDADVCNSKYRVN